ncbi:MAG: hypothetical protein BWY74_02781 [Firmicutes bacterium ADurb.Bin419]|nr:MAG: hypothetical protein BWY74_02781 [Firmicutes bacterium ADurb.Bin419]
MKCKYDEFFIQKYNDGDLSIEEKSEFEKHLSYCTECSNGISDDKALLSYLAEDKVTGGVPVTSIVSRIDLDRYKVNSREYKIKHFISRLKPSLKIAVPVVAFSLIFIVIASNPPLSKYLVDGAANLLNKGERVKSQFVKEVGIEEVDNKTVELRDDNLVQKLNEYGMGVSPWEVSYADKDKVFFRNYASLVGYKDGHIYRVADLKALKADHVQGSVVSEFKFNPRGSHVAIGNFNAEDEYKSSIYMLNTDTGKYFIVGDGNYANITDNWSFDGRYYVFADKNPISGIRLFDTHTDKLYEIKNPGVSIEKIFVNEEGVISFYTSGDVYFLSAKTYDVEKKSSIDFEPLFLEGKSKTAIAYKAGNIEKHYLERDKIEVNGFGLPEQNSVGTDENNIYIDNNRFVVFKVSDDVGIYDLKENSITSLSSSRLPKDGSVSSLRVSPEGEWVLFNDWSNINYFGKNDEGVLEGNYVYPLWMSDSKIVFINLYSWQGLETTVGDIMAGEFEIVTYDVISKEKSVIFNSVNKTDTQKTHGID